MALPSQTDRSSELGRSGINTGRGKGPDPVVIALGLLVVAALVFGVIAVLKSSGNKSADGPLAKTPESNLLAASPDGAPATNGSNGEPKVEPKLEPKSGVKTDTKSDMKPEIKTESRAPGPLVLNQGGTNTPNSAAPAPGTPESSKPAPVDVTNTNSTATGTPTAPGAATITPTASTMDVLALIEAGDRAVASGNSLSARALYSKAMLDSRITAQDQSFVRTKLTKLSDELMFGGKATAGDPLTEEYKVVSGDRLVNLPKKLQVPVTGDIIARVNKLANPNALRIGQTLHVPRGPFHVVVTKSQFVADVYAGSPEEPEQWTFVKSFRVGLGTDDGTPVGSFVVRNKMSNPSWVNPRTGQKFDKDDPKNPIGERWVGLEGVGTSSGIKGYGLHGTIEADSIGQQKSMGCVRFGDDDVKWIYDFMVERISVVQIRP